MLHEGILENAFYMQDLVCMQRQKMHCITDVPGSLCLQDVQSSAFFVSNFLVYLLLAFVLLCMFFSYLH